MTFNPKTGSPFSGGPMRDEAGAAGSGSPDLKLAKPLLLAAAAFEAMPLMHELVAGQHEFDFAPVGIGPFPAFDLSLGKLASGRDVIFVGTAGIFGNFTEAFLVSVNAARWWPTCERMNLSYQAASPAPELRWKQTDLGRDLPAAIALCSPNVSLTDAMTAEPAPSEAGASFVETIELYRLAREIVPKCRSLTVILGITNSVGPESRQQWRQNFKICADQTAAYIIQGLNRGNKTVSSGAGHE